MKLTDNEILSIFGQVLMHRDSPSFIKTYADCVCQASQRDFLILRPTSLVLIGKYNLGHLLEGSDPNILVHNFPGRRVGPANHRKNPWRGLWRPDEYQKLIAD